MCHAAAPGMGHLFAALADEPEQRSNQADSWQMQICLKDRVFDHMTSWQDVFLVQQCGISSCQYCTFSRINTLYRNVCASAA